MIMEGEPETNEIPPAETSEPDSTTPESEEEAKKRELKDRLKSDLETHLGNEIDRTDPGGQFS